MRINVPALPAIIFGLIVILFSACGKIIDRLPDESTLCSVQMITDPTLNPTEFGPTDTVRFFYDNYGNPDSIVKLETATGQYDYRFWYDREHRLTDYIGTLDIHAPSDGSTFETWDKYYYKNGRIALDTTFQFGFINGTRPIPERPDNTSDFIGRITSYEYDPEGRISHTTDSFVSGFVESNTYSYDRAGNLTKKITMTQETGSIFPPFADSTLYSGFDNKINPYRTNPIWQFLGRNYSRNLQFPADSYDQIGLPTLYSNGHVVSSPLLPFPFTFLNIGPRTFSYSCDYPGRSGGHNY